MRERLIGAAVLVVIAVILIPWLVSRAHRPRVVVTHASWPAGASAPARPYVLPLQSTAPATSTAVAAAAPAMRTTKAGKVAVARALPPVARSSASGGPATGHEVATGAHEAPPSGTADRSAPAAGQATGPVGGWSIQAASFSDVKAAGVLADRLREAGFDVSIARHQVRGTTYYRVRVGPYPDEARARSAAPDVARISKTRVLIRGPGSEQG